MLLHGRAEQDANSDPQWHCASPARLKTKPTSFLPAPAATARFVSMGWDTVHGCTLLALLRGAAQPCSTPCSAAVGAVRALSCAVPLGFGHRCSEALLLGSAHPPPSAFPSPLSPGFGFASSSRTAQWGRGECLEANFPITRNQGWEQEPERGGGRAATPFNSVPPPVSPHPLLSNPVSPACDAHLAAVHRLLPCCRMRGKRKQHQKDSWWSSVALTYLDPLPLSLSRLECWLQPARSGEQNGNECE